MEKHKKWGVDPDDKEALSWYDQHHRENMRNWRAWGSWFSWGSPIGLGLFYSLVILSTGVFIWLLHISR